MFAKNHIVCLVLVYLFVKFIISSELLKDGITLKDRKHRLLETVQQLASKKNYRKSAPLNKMGMLFCQLT